MTETGAFQKAVDQVAQVLSQADSIVVFVGAGMSAESGLDVFRGPGGLYDEFNDEQPRSRSISSRSKKINLKPANQW